MKIYRIKNEKEWKTVPNNLTSSPFNPFCSGELSVQFFFAIKLGRRCYQDLIVKNSPDLEKQVEQSLWCRITGKEHFSQLGDDSLWWISCKWDLASNQYSAWQFLLSTCQQQDLEVESSSGYCVGSWNISQGKNNNTGRHTIMTAIVQLLQHARYNAN